MILWPRAFDNLYNTSCKTRSPLVFLWLYIQPQAASSLGQINYFFLYKVKVNHTFCKIIVNLIADQGVDLEAGQDLHPRAIPEAPQDLDQSQRVDQDQSPKVE